MSGSCVKMGFHAEPFTVTLIPLCGRRVCSLFAQGEFREASAFTRLKTKKCRFLAALGMTGPVDFFTPTWYPSLRPFLPLRQLYEWADRTTASWT